MVHLTCRFRAGPYGLIGLGVERKGLDPVNVRRRMQPQIFKMYVIYNPL